ncbi:DUF4124 domain-containing protein [Marinimicrobium agarilyticum]|uniref:DUF4124 domain-containing protein n=1 Tax=Marinimicrobium agarilyticum TaxID=306546 RepID=UPI00041D3005|nr:DUF4124 domain-containing protein [Marinimicrobium agarilyticum]
MRPILIGTLLSLLASPTLGQAIYKSVDEDGNVSYSDRPPNGAQPESAETLPPVNTLPEQQPGPAYRNRNGGDDQEQSAIDYELSLASPAPESHVNPGQRDLPIVLNANPGLAAGHAFAFYLDGELLAETRSNQYVVEEIFRGEHQIRGMIIDENGNMLRETETITIYVHRPSKLN